MNDLVDTTEMYLRTVYELEEEGVPPLRARIAERLAQSGPTVSQTVSRMERDGLLIVAGDRHLELTPQGRARAIGVMRKHRLAELLLVDVIGLEWEQVHNEACRWEHVMSEAVERKLVALLGEPDASPYGNPIPGLDDLGMADHPVGGPDPSLRRVEQVGLGGGGQVEVRRIAEHLQLDEDLMTEFRTVGLRPGAELTVSGQQGEAEHGRVKVTGPGGSAMLDNDVAHAILVAIR